jgi:hypothetical protein
MGENMENPPIPTADQPAPHNSTEKDSYGEGVKPKKLPVQA